MTDSKQCPKCGGEMEYEVEQIPTSEEFEDWVGEQYACTECDYIERIPCGHEEKVK